MLKRSANHKCFKYCRQEYVQILSTRICSNIQGFLAKPPRGVGFFFRQFELRLAKKKTPPPTLLFLVFLFRVKMKRNFLVVNDKKENRAKIERRKASPKFEEVNSVQLICLAAIISSGRHKDYGEEKMGWGFVR